MSLRVFPGALLACMAVLAGCSGGSSDGASRVVTDPAAFTVSHRNQVRLPWDGSALTAERFAEQLRGKDPIASNRCGAEESPAFRDLTGFLGGIAWSHPMAILKDASLPPLYQSKQDFSSYAEGAASSADAREAAPNIERPDLVGVRNGIGIFLSKKHGLIAVDARSGAPTVSCSMKLPGAPMNFFFKNDELVVVVNALNGHNRSALMRFSVKDAKFGFVDAVRLPNQTVRDARLFDSTIVAYTDWSKERAPAQIQEPSVGSGPAAYVGGYGRGGGAMPSGDAAYYPGGSDNRLGAKLIVVNWDDSLAIDWEDTLLDDVKKQDPMEGRDPATPLEPGQVVSTWTSWKQFVAASDRYIAIPRDVQRTKFSHYETYNYQVCTAYNPQHHQIESCNVSYEKRPNPDYKAPSAATGDYSCNGQKLSDCIAQAAPVVSQFIYVPVGQSCQMVWVGQCEKYEPRSTTYPKFETEAETELTIYRFENGSFTKLDSSLAKMVEKPGAIAFETGPLAVKGSISNRNQVQFQNGHLYVFSDGALQTMAVAGNSIAYVTRYPVSASTSSNPSVVFSTDRAMISAVDYYANGQQASNVEMLDLTEPALPKPLNAFRMPGQSTQLILANGGILGPGQVAFANAGVNRSLQKLTLFSNADGNELDNLLLGTEYDTFESSWFTAQDDQRIRLGSNGTRVFIPYSGRHHADQYEPTAHRLNVTRLEGGRLVSERSFSVSDEIIRTAAIDDARSLVFGDSATYLIDRATGDWALSTLREMFVPFATYRLSDGGLHARIDRVGSKCRVVTFGSDAAIFGATPLAQADVPCSETGNPLGFGSALLWSETRTGVKISADGLKIDLLSATDVAAMLEKLPKDEYCYLEEKTGPTYAVDYLDAVPAKIFCESSNPTR